MDAMIERNEPIFCVVPMFQSRIFSRTYLSSRGRLLLIIEECLVISAS